MDEASQPVGYGATAREPYDNQLGETPDVKSDTRGTLASNKVPYIMSVVNHAILVAFTLYIVILCFCDTYKLFLWHPALMTIGCFLLMAEAIMAMSQDSPYTGKFGRTQRVQLHWILQALAASLIFIGLIIIVVNKNISGFGHFHTWHSIFGLITVIFVGMTSSGGVAALYSIKMKQLIRPALIKLIHNFAGIIAYIFGVITIILSLYSGWYINQPSSSTASQIIWIILICVSAFLTLQSASKSAYLRATQMFR